MKRNKTSAKLVERFCFRESLAFHAAAPQGSDVNCKKALFGSLFALNGSVLWKKMIFKLYCLMPKHSNCIDNMGGLLPPCGGC